MIQKINHKIAFIDCMVINHLILFYSVAYTSLTQELFKHHLELSGVFYYILSFLFGAESTLNRKSSSDKFTKQSNPG